MSPDKTLRLPALDALARGIANVRANSELLVVQLVSALLIVVSIAVPVLFPDPRQVTGIP